MVGHYPQWDLKRLKLPKEQGDGFGAVELQVDFCRFLSGVQHLSTVNCEPM